HHIVADWWSIGIFLRELATLYVSVLQGRPSPLPELAIQYADFAVYQRRRLQGEILETQLSYWRRRLAGAPGLELQTDRPRPAVQTYSGQTYSFALPKAALDSLKQFGNDEGATLFMTLLAAFQSLLFRYTGQEDFVVGSPVSNRSRAEM